MATLNYAFKELSCKIVYYGCGLCGKTTNLIYIHKTVPQKFRGELVSLATEQDRTLFFDFLPLDLGEVKGFKTKFQLYTVPGQVYYNATRKLVLRGVDGIVFVIDSQRDRFQENIDSLENLKTNLAEYGLHLQTGPDDLEGIPWVIQYNKRDMPQVSTIEELEQGINVNRVPYCEAVAFNGQGVKETLKRISSLVIKRLNAETPGASPLIPATATPAKPASSASDFSAMSKEEMDDIDRPQGAGSPSASTTPGSGKPKLPDPKPKTAESSKPAPASPTPAPAAAAPKPAAPKPAAPAPAPAPAAAKAPAAPAPAPAAPAPAPAKAPAAPAGLQVNVTKQYKALWRGVGLGNANLTLANLVGGEANQFQLTGKVSFLGIFGGTWSRKLRLGGKETKNEGGTSATFHKLVSDDGQNPALELWVKDDAEKAFYVTYLGTGGQVQIVPPGKQPLS